jgi:hypothetical protein
LDGGDRRLQGRRAEYAGDGGADGNACHVPGRVDGEVGSRSWPPRADHRLVFRCRFRHFARSSQPAAALPSSSTFHMAAVRAGSRSIRVLNPAVHSTSRSAQGRIGSTPWNNSKTMKTAVNRCEHDEQERLE